MSDRRPSVACVNRAKSNVVANSSATSITGGTWSTSPSSATVLLLGFHRATSRRTLKRSFGM
ncbi:hypothetical protein DAEQUDRAFT_147998 [Daedalea quercina L-15889]|uniref:Uncharacterized protein n=1 Tax=Daedalea quercina L-15889 TaxID=1314783 RepID=A0A165KMP6_9APHY|nr:hypothetical protein DAEQUDRAFT_147998 [Daedalea quercina L-15889]